MKQLLLFLSLLLFAHAQIQAQPAILDATFENNGIVINNFGGGNGVMAKGIALFPDHKIIATGPESGSILCIRYKENGDFDSRFGNMEFLQGHTSLMQMQLF